MSGPSLPLDPRLHAYRRDIADVALAGQIFAPRYARPVIQVAGADASAVWAEPAAEAEAVSDLNPGDEFAVLDVASGWAWGYRRSNHSVGYVPAEHLGPTKAR